MDTYTTGSWKPFPDQKDAFVDAWIEFSNWASTMPAGRAILARDLRDPDRFVSFVEWESIDTITIGSIHHRSGSVFALGYKPTSSAGADFYNGAMKSVSVAIG